MLGCAQPQTAPDEPSRISAPVADVELSFDEQLARVLNGEAIAIRLTQTQISAQQLRQLAPASEKLLELQLDAGIVDDSSIAELSNLTSLEHLRLRDSPITNAGVIKLAANSLLKLRVLNLPQSTLTVTGLEHLAGFPKLVQLRLSATELDDRAAEVLATFPALRSLHLIGPKFTDAALEQLALAPQLSSLYIDDCHLSDAAWQQLFMVKPNLHVHIDQHHHDRDPHWEH